MRAELFDYITIYSWSWCDQLELLAKLDLRVVRINPTTVIGAGAHYYGYYRNKVQRNIKFHYGALRLSDTDIDTWFGNQSVHGDH